MIPYQDTDLSKIILQRTKRSTGDDTESKATVGVFLLDYNIQDNRRMFFDYINDFHNESGLKLDCFIPGFICKDHERGSYQSKWNDYYLLDNEELQESIIDLEDYEFREKLYRKAVNQLGEILRTNLRDYLGPQLVLIDVTVNHRDRIVRYNDSCIIEIKNDASSNEVMEMFRVIVQMAGKGYDSMRIKRLRYLYGWNTKKIANLIRTKAPAFLSEIVMNVIVSSVCG